MGFNLINGISNWNAYTFFLIKLENIFLISSQRTPPQGYHTSNGVNSAVKSKSTMENKSQLRLNCESESMTGMHVK